MYWELLDVSSKQLVGHVGGVVVVLTPNPILIVQISSLIHALSCLTVIHLLVSYLNYKLTYKFPSS